MKRLSIFLAVLAAVSILAFLFLPARPRPAATGGSVLHVVATFYPLAEFARQVGGSSVEVRTLVPSGAEPHDYEPTPQDIVAASSADVFLINGGVDAWAERVLPDLRSAGVGIVRVADTMPDIDHDPHVWLDPALAAKIVGLIRDAFVSARPELAAKFDADASSYIAKLQALDADYQAGLSACSTRQVVASHDALGYMAKHYGLDVVPIAGLSPDEEPSPARMAEITKLAKAAGAKYIFFEALVSPKLAQTIAGEIGAGTMVFNPLEGLTDQEIAAGKDYLTVMRDNLENLRTALVCQ